jgi:hypothetical protein
MAESEAAEAMVFVGERGSFAFDDFVLECINNVVDVSSVA